MSTPNIKPAPPVASPAAQASTAESLGWQLRAALPPLRLHSVSLYDLAGEILWLSEGALGPDEQAFVTEALGELARDPSAAHLESDLRDGRSAMFLAVRSPRSELVGLAMILADAKSLSQGGLAGRVLTPSVRTVLQRLAICLNPALNAPGVSDPDLGPPTAEPGPPRTAPSTEIELDELAPEEVEQILTFELEEKEFSSAPIAAPIAIQPPEPADGKPGMLLQELAKLRPGGRLRRFQVLPQPAGPGEKLADAATAPAAAAHALAASLRELVTWLDGHAALWEQTPISFAVSVPAPAIEAELLPCIVADQVRAAGVPAESIGFEISEAVCISHPSSVEPFVRAVEQIGSFLTIDDFTFDSRALDLLRSKALRLVTVDPELIAAALRDKLAQARVVAISQAARVLGIHCAAKHVDGPATRRWLAAAGFDFAEGALFDAPRSLASLAAELASR